MPSLPFAPSLPSFPSTPFVPFCPFLPSIPSLPFIFLIACYIAKKESEQATIEECKRRKILGDITISDKKDSSKKNEQPQNDDKPITGFAVIKKAHNAELPTNKQPKPPESLIADREKNTTKKSNKKNKTKFTVKQSYINIFFIVIIIGLILFSAFQYFEIEKQKKALSDYDLKISYSDVESIKGDIEDLKKKIEILRTVLKSDYKDKIDGEDLLAEYKLIYEWDN